LRALAAGDVTQAILEFSKAIFFAPDYAEFYCNRAQAYLSICDLKSALLNLKQVQRIDANDRAARVKVAYLHYLIGQSFLDNMQLESALHCFEEAIDCIKTNSAFLIRKYVLCDSCCLLLSGRSHYS